MSIQIRLALTEDLTPAELIVLRELCDTAFRERDAPRVSRGLAFTDEDWDHACGGVHAFVLEDGVPMAHASAVERDIHIDGVSVHTGYVEAVATRPDRQRRGLGSAVMIALGDDLRRRFALGALNTSRHRFYERLGWERWRGPTFVRIESEVVATPEEDGYVMILPTSTTPTLDLGATISCDWRSGDVW